MLPPDVRFKGYNALKSIFVGILPDQCSPDSLAEFKGPTSKARKKGRGGQESGGVKGRGGAPTLR